MMMVVVSDDDNDDDDDDDIYNDEVDYDGDIDVTGYLANPPTGRLC